MGETQNSSRPLPAVHFWASFGSVLRCLIVHLPEKAEAGELDGAVLKARSPSCGCGAAWQDGEVRAVDGVFAALLRSRGIPIGTEEARDPALGLVIDSSRPN